MITVVHDDVQYRVDAVEGDGLYAFLFQFMDIAWRKRTDRAEVIVHYSDVNSLSCLLLQNVQYTEPHLTFLNDEVLQEDELFCLAQFL